MIRIFTLLCKLNQIKISDREWFEQEIRTFHSKEEVCPSCGAKGCCRKHSAYIRDLIGLRDGKICRERVRVMRVKCSSCRCTHAVLPSCVAAGGSYSLRFILRALQALLLRKMTIEEICERFQIAHSTLYTWRKQFRAHRRLWLGVLNAAEQKETAFFREMSGELLQDFFQKFRYAFLQKEYKPSADFRSSARGGPEEKSHSQNCGMEFPDHEE